MSSIVAKITFYSIIEGRYIIVKRPYNDINEIYEINDTENGQTILLESDIQKNPSIIIDNQVCTFDYSRTRSIKDDILLIDAYACHKYISCIANIKTGTVNIAEITEKMEKMQNGNIILMNTQHINIYNENLLLLFTWNNTTDEMFHWMGETRILLNGNILDVVTGNIFSRVRHDYIIESTWCEYNKRLYAICHYNLDSARLCYYEEKSNEFISIRTPSDEEDIITILNNQGRYLIINIKKTCLSNYSKTYVLDTDTNQFIDWHCEACKDNDTRHAFLKSCERLYCYKTKTLLAMPLVYKNTKALIKEILHRDLSDLIDKY